MQDCRMGKLSGLLGYLNIWNIPPPSLMPREQSWGFYLKLHGSLDWIQCPTELCPNNNMIFALGVTILSEGQAEGMPCRYCGAALKTFIVPPIATKRLQDKGRMAFLWNLALKALTAADKIAIIGISFAPSDFELRWLVRQAIALRKNQNYELHIVNRDGHHRASIAKVFPGTRKIVFEHDSAESYISMIPISSL